ncbi:MAG TPA: helix-turn-helix transcriptional regulator [Acidimicrobiales bacterium]|nr:helix-turn-helix transcriptional regulator [Acidimicrobiales bacterium]
MVGAIVVSMLTMDFAHRLAAARKERGLTQQGLADRVGIHVTQIRRYEAGSNSPTLDVLAKLATSLNVTIDSLVFDEHERDPDEDLRLVFEATKHLDPAEREMVKSLIEAVLLKHEARRWTNVS